MQRYIKWALIAAFAIVFIAYTFDLNIAQKNPNSPHGGDERERSTGDDQARDDYTNKIHPLAQRMSRSLDKVAKISEEVDSEEIDFNEAADAVSKEHDELRNIKEEMQKIETPKDLGKFHSHFLKGLGYYIEGSELYTDGLNNKDKVKVDGASDLFNKGNTEIENAAKELDKHLSGKLDLDFGLQLKK